MAVRARLLGQPTFVDGSSRHDPPVDKRVGLLAYLAWADDWVPRERLAFLFWPDAPPNRARSNLRGLLARVRRLPFARDMHAEDGRVRWLVESDVRAFRSAYARQEWDAAVDAYGGELLLGAALDGAGELDAWIGTEREAFRSAYRTALLGLCRQRRPEDASTSLVPRLAQVLTDDPYDEEAARCLMALHAAAGDRVQAGRVARTLREHLSAELDLPPSEETEALANTIERGERPGGTPAAAPERHGVPAGCGLPRPTTPFVAREAEREDLTARLARTECRLVTVVGSGGVGKTRLALQVAWDLAGSYHDGAHFVATTHAHGPQEVAIAVADALGVRLAGDERAEVALPRQLSTWHGLLVLDDLHPEEGTASFLRELLRACASLDLLVASRERLDASEAWVVPLQGLARPTPASAPEEARRAPAVRLFADAASRVVPSFRLGDDEVPQVVRICRLVDGLPLGLELAAAWVRALPLRDLADELERNLDLLRRTSPGHDDRHRSVRAAFEHSWARLGEDEASALAALSVFRNGFRRDAAAQVAGTSIPRLTGLIDRSLLRLDADGRYGFHPLVERLAGEKLSARPRLEASVRGSHRAYYLDWTERAAARFARSTAPELAERTAREYGNVTAALDDAVADGDAEIAARIAASLEWFWLWRGRLREGRARLERVIQLDFPPGSVAHAGALEAASTLAMLQNERAEGRAHATQALAVARESGDRNLVGRCLNNLGFDAMRRDRHEEADALLGEAVELAADEVERLLPLLNRGAAAARARRDVQARRLLEEAIATATRLDNHKRGDLARLHLGRLDRLRGHHAAAIRSFDGVLRHQHHVQHGEIQARAHLYRAMAARDDGDAELAGQHLCRALDLWWEIGTFERLADVARLAAALRADVGALDEAAALRARADSADADEGSMLFPDERAQLARAVPARPGGLHPTAVPTSAARSDPAGTDPPEHVELVARIREVVGC